MLKSLFLSSAFAAQAFAYWIPSNWFLSNNNNNNNGGGGGGGSGFGDSAGLDNYAQSMLNWHNQDRAAHGVPPLTYNYSAAASASSWASNCFYEHNHMGDGQNIAFFTSTAGDSILDAAQRAMNGWYQGEVGNYINQYGAASPGLSDIDIFAHFTQIVWASTTSVGCATQQCNVMGNTAYSASNGWNSYFTVCDYYPQGNIWGYFGQDVFPPGSFFKE